MCSGRITQSCSQKFHKVFLCGSSIQQKWVNNVVTKCMQSLQYFVKAEKKHGLVRGAMLGAVEGSTGAARPCRKSPKAVLDPVKGGCRHAYCPLCTYAQFEPHKTCARRCKNVHGVCTHVGPPALSRLLHHPPFLSLFRWAKCTSHWVVYTYTGLVGWVMKRWLAAIKRVREVFHPLECMSAPPPPPSAPQ